MKITINLSEEAYKRICGLEEGTTGHQLYLTTLELYKAVREGTPEKAPEEDEDGKN